MKRQAGPMKRTLDISPQPDETTCGPTCLHALYQYYGDKIPLGQVVSEVKALDEGGTLAVFLGIHALRRGYTAEIYTFNLHVFDPTWFGSSHIDLEERLRSQTKYKKDKRLTVATHGYLEYLHMGGVIRFHDLNIALIKNYLYKGFPIIAGLSATYLYKSMREIGITNTDDDLRGEPSGHFVVLIRYDINKKRILLADPYKPNPYSHDQYYYINVNRIINSILLGVITYDSNLLIIKPKET
jgi:hypothetical protein